MGSGEGQGRHRISDLGPDREIVRALGPPYASAETICKPGEVKVPIAVPKGDESVGESRPGASSLKVSVVTPVAVVDWTLGASAVRTRLASASPAASTIAAAANVGMLRAFTNAICPAL